MTDSDLDHCYGVLADALEQAGPDRASLLLSMVCLGMMGRMAGTDDVLPLIEQARRLLAQDRAAANTRAVGLLSPPTVK